MTRFAWWGRLGSCAALAAILPVATAAATPSLVIDVASGQVLEQDHATQPWFPASLTKLMTVYVALTAVREGKVSFDTPFVMSARAAHVPPSRMGFAPGTQVTLDNALKMLMVKSANDIAVMIAEGLGGSVEGFSDQMNAMAARLGLHESHFSTPNGLPDPRNYTSARDLATIARALYLDFPDQADLYGIGALDLNGQIIATHNGLLGRYPGADGMKTGYICSSGFNIVVSATRNGHKLIAVVLGAPRTRPRDLKAAALLDVAFAGGLRPQGSIDRLPMAAEQQPIDMRDQICGRRRGRGTEEDSAVDISTVSSRDGAATPLLQAAGLSPGQAATTQFVWGGRPAFTPVPVFIGPRPGWSGAVAQATPVIPASASAYAPADTPARGPLGVDPSAQPLRLSGAAKTKPRQTAALPKPVPAAASPAAKAAALKPPAAKPVAKTAAAQPPVKTAAKVDTKKPAVRTGGKPAVKAILKAPPAVIDE